MQSVSYRMELLVEQWEILQDWRITVLQCYRMYTADTGNQDNLKIKCEQC